MTDDLAKTLRVYKVPQSCCSQDNLENGGKLENFVVQEKSYSYSFSLLVHILSCALYGRKQKFCDFEAQLGYLRSFPIVRLSSKRINIFLPSFNLVLPWPAV